MNLWNSLSQGLSLQWHCKAHLARYSGNSSPGDLSCQAALSSAVKVEEDPEESRSIEWCSPSELSLDTGQNQSLASSHPLQCGWAQSGLTQLSELPRSGRSPATGQPVRLSAPFQMHSKPSCQCRDSAFWRWHVYFETIIKLDLIQWKKLVLAEYGPIITALIHMD